MKAYLFLLFFLLISFAGQAQSEIEMADQFRADGKIYVVVAILVIIFCLLAFYLVRLDKKITKLEKEQDEA